MQLSFAMRPLALVQLPTQRDSSGILLGLCFTLTARAVCENGRCQLV
jgi:hypothetical protein